MPNMKIVTASTRHRKASSGAGTAATAWTAPTGWGGYSAIDEHFLGVGFEPVGSGAIETGTHFAELEGERFRIVVDPWGDD